MKSSRYLPTTAMPVPEARVLAVNAGSTYTYSSGAIRPLLVVVEGRYSRNRSPADFVRTGRSSPVSRACPPMISCMKESGRNRSAVRRTAPSIVINTGLFRI
nr:hypothetical protein [Human alphaherpesvirus 2]